MFIYVNKNPYWNFGKNCIKTGINLGRDVIFAMLSSFLFNIQLDQTADIHFIKHIWKHCCKAPIF